jgi:hypothetical protein
MRKKSNKLVSATAQYSAREGWKILLQDKTVYIHNSDVLTNDLKYVYRFTAL